MASESRRFHGTPNNSWLSLVWSVLAGYGIEANDSFECVLSLPLPSTAVTT